MTIRIRRACLGLAGFSGILALGVGCRGSVEPVIVRDAPGDGQGQAHGVAIRQPLASDTVVHASVRLGLGFHDDGPDPHATYVLRVLGSTGDGFIRPGDRVVFDLPSFITMGKIFGPGNFASTMDELGDVHASVKAIFLKGSAPVSSQVVPTGHWVGSQVPTAFASTSEIEVPAGADGLSFEVAITRTSDPSANGSIEPEEMNPLPIFASDPSVKTVLFDAADGRPRERLIEGDVTRGATLHVAYTNGRADDVADVSTLDRSIGRARDESRFGAFEREIYGDIVHEVSYAVSYGDERGFLPEQPMTADDSSRVEPTGAKVFETSLTIPDDAPQVSLRFHVRTYLVVNYGRDATERRYHDGQRILVRETQDEPVTSPGYGFPVEAAR